MAEAVFQLEENLADDRETPLVERDGIDRYYLLVKEAGWKMPESRRRRNWVWRTFMEKAALDKYVQLAVTQELGVQRRIEERIGRAQQADAALLVAVFEELEGAGQRQREKQRFHADRGRGCGEARRPVRRCARPAAAARCHGTAPPRCRACTAGHPRRFAGPGRADHR